jgi:hypothetical protein
MIALLLFDILPGLLKTLNAGGYFLSSLIFKSLKRF